MFSVHHGTVHDELENGLLLRGQHRSTAYLGNSSVPANVFEDVVTECAARSRVTVHGVTTGLVAGETVDGVTIGLAAGKTADGITTGFAARVTVDDVTTGPAARETVDGATKGLAARVTVDSLTT